MTVKCLTESQKQIICQWYKQKLYTQTQLAKQFSTSTRTINRVLEEKGLATPVARLKGEAYQVMQVVKEFGLDAQRLRAALTAPALTFNNVQFFLNQCPPEQLGQLFYKSGLIKLVEALKAQTRQSAPVPAQEVRHAQAG